MIEEIIGEDRRASEEIFCVSTTGWFGELIARPASVRVALDGLAQFELRWGW